MKNLLFLILIIGFSLLKYIIINLIIVCARFEFELEGNLIVPKTAYELGELLKINKVIRYLDLEFNNLTASGTNVDGIKNIAEVN